MPKNTVTIEIFRNNRWQTAAEVTFDADGLIRGFSCGSFLSYDIDYAVAYIGSESALDRVSCLYEVDFSNYRQKHWPSFLLDIIPTGAAREYWLKKLSIKDDDTSSWLPLLQEGAGSPPGNLRIAQAVKHTPQTSLHHGFNRQQIIEKNADFLEYAESCGAIVAGATDVQGQAPKFLIVQDHNGFWHAEGALADEDKSSHWLVKFPRGNTIQDKIVLRNEAPYYRVAQTLGVHTGANLDYAEGSLFIRRFDRKVTTNGIERYGLESLCSATNIATFGKTFSHNTACSTIMRFSSNPVADIEEYLLRDVLNVAMRNTDNHGRNTAFLKVPGVGTRLSPLYDFAPMFIDPEGIPRSTRWQGNAEIQIGSPDWAKVAEDLHLELGLKQDRLKDFFYGLYPRINSLPQTMQSCGVDDEIIERLAPRIAQTAINLAATQP